jgi:hypothetical protein
MEELHFICRLTSRMSGSERTWMTRSHEKLALRWNSALAAAICMALLAAGALMAGCDSAPPKSAAEAEKKPAAPAIPQDAQDAAASLLGSDAQVLVYGDLAKTGVQQMLAANVVPNTPKSTVAGTVVTRAVVAQNVDGKWTELLRADEYLKNQKGYLALTPLQSVSGWKLQYENTPEKGLALYFTPIKQGSSEKTLPIEVKWNPETKRYQSLNYTYDKFLPEAPSLDSPRSTLR